jgi:hypothetical protein
MILKFCKKNVYLILVVLSIFLIFEPIKNWCASNWNWLGFFVIIICGLLYSVECIIKWINFHYTDEGKRMKMVVTERKREAQQFYNELFHAKQVANHTGDWSQYISANDRKHKQISDQNIRLLNMWLKKELDRGIDELDSLEGFMM